MSARLTRERTLDALEAQTGLVRFALQGAGVDLQARVAACPEWSAHELVAHLGAVTWWGGQNVRDRTPDARARGLRKAMEGVPPAEDGVAALTDWYTGISAELLETLAAADLDAPVWTFAGPGHARFWPRRMLHETAIHRWDLEAALGGASATTPLPEDVAVDCVDEFCTEMRPLVALARPELPATLRLRAVLHPAEGLAAGAEPVGAVDPGSDLEWLVQGSDGTPEAEVTGPPEALALLVWGRVGVDAAGLEIAGDRAALDAALEAGLAV